MYNAQELRPRALLKSIIDPLFPQDARGSQRTLQQALADNFVKLYDSRNFRKALLLSQRESFVMVKIFE